MKLANRKTVRVMGAFLIAGTGMLGALGPVRHAAAAWGDATGEQGEIEAPRWGDASGEKGEIESPRWGDASGEKGEIEAPRWGDASGEKGEIEAPRSAVQQ
jgi:hypothetical protein